MHYKKRISSHAALASGRCSWYLKTCMSEIHLFLWARGIPNHLFLGPRPSKQMLKVRMKGNIDRHAFPSQVWRDSHLTIRLRAPRILKASEWKKESPCICREGQKRPRLHPLQEELRLMQEPLWSFQLKPGCCRHKPAIAINCPVGISENSVRHLKKRGGGGTLNKIWMMDNGFGSCRREDAINNSLSGTLLLLNAVALINLINCAGHTNMPVWCLCGCAQWCLVWCGKQRHPGYGQCQFQAGFHDAVSWTCGSLCPWPEP